MYTYYQMKKIVKQAISVVSKYVGVKEGSSINVRLKDLGS